MKIHVLREACCAQDDQMGPLDRWFDLPEGCSLGEFLATVVTSRFLQYSSTHTTLRCRADSQLVATVFSPYLAPARDTVYAVPPEASVRELTRGGPFEFMFDRAGDPRT